MTHLHGFSLFFPFFPSQPSSLFFVSLSQNLYIISFCFMSSFSVSFNLFLSLKGLEEASLNASGFLVLILLLNTVFSVSDSPLVVPSLFLFSLSLPLM